jgi:Zn-finger nucleic acid-binding protein
MGCSQCGATIALSLTESVVCKFCNTVNLPLPKEVPVPVPVNVVHNVVQVVGHDGAPVEVRCPHCRKRLVGVEVDGATLHGCGGCGGIWVDNASARKVLSTPVQTFTVLAQRAAKNAKGGARQPRPTCAACPAILDKVRVHGIELDICQDHGTWFDALELSRLTSVLRGEALPGAVASQVSGDAVCGGCRQTFPADRLNITDLGGRCDACWRGEQSALIRAADRDHTSTTAVVGAVTLGLVGAMLGAASRR